MAKFDYCCSATWMTLVVNRVLNPTADPDSVISMYSFDWQIGRVEASVEAKTGKFKTGMFYEKAYRAYTT